MSGAAGDPRRERARAIADFAVQLRALRASAGDPSFREMAAHSRAISHTTLHEAAQGHRLPSWATTVEFVKVCGIDPETYRGRWEAANRAVRAASAGAREQARLDGAPPGGTRPAAGAPTATVRPDERGPGDDRVADPAVPDDARPGPARRFALPRRRSVVLGAMAAGAAAILIGTSLTDAAGNGSAHPTVTPIQRTVTSADCPVRQRNPPPSPPAHEGDRAAFVADITLPDCTHLARGRQAVKVWRFKNSGAVRWHGYSLHRIDLPQHRDQCQTIVDVPVPDTSPGEIVDIRTAVTAPPDQGFCFVRFKMRDGEGNVAFPGSRPVYFQLIID